MSVTPVGQDAWNQEPPLVSEAEFTPWGEGWSAWNERAPEYEFVKLLGSLVSLVKPRVVIETGVGMGFATREILATLGERSELWAYESSPEIRSMVPEMPKLILSNEESPQPQAYKSAQLVVMDSRLKIRLKEITDFSKNALRGTILLIHDVGDRGAGPVQVEFRDHILSLSDRITGAFLPNPRGSWIGSKI